MKIIYSSDIEVYPHFCVFLTTACNFKCNYCFSQSYIHNNHEIFTIEDIRLFTQSLYKLKEYEVILLGGEPLLHPKISDIVNIFIQDQRCNTVVILSNGSLDYESKNIPLNSKVSPVLTFHETQNYNKNIFLKNCWYLKDQDLKVSFYLSNKTPKTRNLIDKLLKFLPQDKLEQIFINTKIQTNVNTRNDYLYFNNKKINIYDVLRFKLNRFKGYKCYNNNYNVYPSGLVTQRCGTFKANFRDWSPKEKNWMVCPMNTCDCILDIKSLKIKN